MKNTAYQTIRQVVFMIFLVILPGGQWLHAARLKPETVESWKAYVKATERRIEEELSSKKKFLALDFQPDSASKEIRRKMRAGEIPVARVKTVDLEGDKIKVPDGLIHHWRGSVFIPGITLNEVYSRVENPSANDTNQEDVLDSVVLERDSESLKMFLKLQRSAIVKVVYNTEHKVSFHKTDAEKAWSRSIATKIAELKDPQTPNEQEKPPGDDSGFLWRLNSYWRYQQVEGGVIVEMESITLSRSIPLLLRPLARPIISKVARESMERTLDSMRTRLTRGQVERESLAHTILD